MRGELIDSVDVVFGFVIGFGEEADGAFNQVDFIAVGVQFGRKENEMSEVVDERVVGVVSLSAVDDNGLEVFVPAVGLAKEFAERAFGFNGVISEAFDEGIGNVFVNVVRIDVAEIIFESRPDVVASEIFEIVHRYTSGNRKSPEPRSSGLVKV